MNGLQDHTRTIEAVCKHLAGAERAEADSLLRSSYAHVSPTNAKRGYSIHQKLHQFIEDGFVDRYSGGRLLFPGVLHVLSAELPEAFPWHRNWKMTETHIAYWELMPTIDHVIPIARGGANEPENWVTTSMARNSAKANWTIEELDWELHLPGNFAEWDGLMGWFIDYTSSRPELLDDVRIKEWARALRQRHDWIRTNVVQNSTDPE